MEIFIKLTDITTGPLNALNELRTLLEESETSNEKLINKGRTKIDLVGNGLLAHIQIKDEPKQPGLPL